MPACALHVTDNRRVHHVLLKPVLRVLLLSSSGTWEKPREQKQLDRKHVQSDQYPTRFFLDPGPALILSLGPCCAFQKRKKNSPSQLVFPKIFPAFPSPCTNQADAGRKKTSRYDDASKEQDTIMLKVHCALHSLCKIDTHTHE